MKKVLLTFDKGLGHGGIQSVIMSIVRGLKDKYTFDVLVNVSEEQFYDNEFLSYGGKIIKVPFYEGDFVFRRRADYYVRGLYLYSNVLSVIKKNGPYDIVHCNNVYESGPILCAAQKCGVPIRVAHSHAIPCKEPWIRDKLNKIYLNQVLRCSSAFIGCSENACKSLFGSKNKSSVIYNAYDDKKYTYQDFGRHDGDTMLIVQVGRYDATKNQLFSLKVVKELLAKGIRVRLVLIGSDQGIEEKKLRTEERKLGIEGNIEYLETNTDILSWLSIADIFLFPSLSEGFGTALIEAQAVGVKCYASDSIPYETNCGGCRYISLEEGPDRWAEIIESDYEKTHGSHRFYDCSRFSPVEIMKDYEKLYG